MTEYVLVYGTLRRGEPRHRSLRGTSFVDEVRLPGFDLVHLGAYPGAVAGEGSVLAERYRVLERRVLAVLDTIEGIAEDPPLFRREQVVVQGEPAWIYVYARDVDGLPRIPGGDWVKRGLRD